jgi:hypothetical protein
MIPELPDLRFLKLEMLVMHENHDHQRTEPLVERIRESGVFRNPPVVMPLADGSQRFMILDGANRVTALRQMDFPDILVQVVRADAPGLRLQNWNHVIWETQTSAVLKGIRDTPGIHLLPTEACDVVEPDLWGDCGLALLQIPDGRLYTVCTDQTELLNRVSLLNAIVDSYHRTCRLDRVGARCIDDLCDLYPSLSALVIFPLFDILDVMSLAGQGYLLPTGITRFTISPRALHINYPLYELAAHKSLEEKNNLLKEWLSRRISKKGIRYYAEATFLYDE